jgi:hypothetical protein
MWAFFFLNSLLGFVGSLICLFFRSLRRKAKWIASASFVAMIVTFSIFLGEQDNEARRFGFLDAADMRAAKEAGIVDPAAWQSRLKQLAKQREAEGAEAERFKDTPIAALRGQPNIVVPAERFAQPFVVTIETSVSGSARPIVTGTTNLPDGTHLSIWIAKPWQPNAKERLAVGLAVCGDDCLPLTATNYDTGDDVLVKNGQFSDGPFTDKGAALRPGTYVLEIMISGASSEPPDVLAIIGSRGEKMTGPLVGACCFGERDQAVIQKTMDEQRRDAPILGASVYYARYVKIGNQPAASPAPSAASDEMYRPNLRVAPVRADEAFDNWPWVDTVFFTPVAPRAPLSARWHYPVTAEFICFRFLNIDPQLAATDPHTFGPACITDADLMARSANNCGQLLKELTGGFNDYDKRGLMRMHVCARQDEYGGNWTVLEGYSDR